MSFVRLENLNDFIEPSSTCIKPVEKKKAAGVVAKVNDISLSDCLACSGCITSAETVLVQQQTHEELFKVINDNKSSKTRKEIVVSMSLQSIASLAQKNGINPQEAAERIASFFVSLGCDKVYDINLARHLALIEAYREYKSRTGDKQKLPIINSVCPGWICYAEKTNGDLIIPHLSKVRSPQQIMGALVKEIRSRDTSCSKSNIYHVTLMPCFDKKLEASRNDFKYPDGDNEYRDVDCVLTPLEFEEILSEEGVTLHDFERRKLDVLRDTQTELDNPLSSHFGSASGGYAENILLAELGELTRSQNEADLVDNLEYSTLKNNDFTELTVKQKTSDINVPKTILRRFAIDNGFRNIQTVVQRLKRSALKYDYIEIMACPSGCINGGAQCRPNLGLDRNQMAHETKRLYDDVRRINSSLSVASVKNQLASSLDMDLDLDKFLYTEFHPVAKMQNLTVSW